MNGMPKPTEEHKRLEKLAGNWIGTETMSASPWGPGGTATGKWNARLDMDGFFLVQEYVQEKEGRVTYRGHGILGWDTQQKDYAWYWVDSIGFVPAAPARGQWKGDTLLLESEGMGQKSRYTFRFTGDGGLYFSIESSADGGKTWSRFMEATNRRA